MVMGATTYEWLLDHEFSGKDRADWIWPYDDPLLGAHAPHARHRSGRSRSPSPAVTSQPVHAEMAHAAGGRDLWVVGGGDLAGQFADAGLLDEVIVSIAPVTLGAGAPLLPRHIELRLEEMGRNGEFACARYAVVREA